MDIREIRRKRLLELIERFDSAAEFARTYGLEPSYLSQITTGHRNLGEKAARKLESQLDKPQGYLDLPELNEAVAATVRALSAGPQMSPDATKLVRWIQQLDAEGGITEGLADALGAVLKLAKTGVSVSAGEPQRPALISSVKFTEIDKRSPQWVQAAQEMAELEGQPPDDPEPPKAKGRKREREKS